MAAVRQELAKPPDPVPDPYKDKIAELHISVTALFTNRQIPYFLQSEAANGGYAAVEDVVNRWEDADKCRRDPPARRVFVVEITAARIRHHPSQPCIWPR